MGVPMKRVKEAENLVDFVFDEGFEVFGKIKSAEKILNTLLDSYDEASDFDAEYDQDAAMTADPQKKQNVINHVPNQDAASLYNSIRRQIGEWKRLNEDAKIEYKKYFNMMLKKWGVKSPAELPPDKKKKFFDAVDKGWKAKKESD